MKPKRVISLALFALVTIAFIYQARVRLEDYTPTKEILNLMLSFVYPAAFFFIFWWHSLKEKHDGDYLESYFDILLVYFLFLMPYVVDKYGMCKLTFLGFVRVVAEGDIGEPFTYMKTAVEFFIILPVIRACVGKIPKISIVIGLIITVVASQISIDEYFNTTYLCKYFVYVVLGVAFAMHEKKAFKFLRNYKKKIETDLLAVVLFIGITRLAGIYNFLIPTAEIFYNIVITLIICYWAFRLKMYYDIERYTGRNAVIDYIMSHPYMLAMVFITHMFVTDIFMNIYNVWASHVIFDIIGAFAFVILLMIYFDVPYVIRDYMEERKRKWLALRKKDNN